MTIKPHRYRDCKSSTGLLLSTSPSLFGLANRVVGFCEAMSGAGRNAEDTQDETPVTYERKVLCPHCDNYLSKKTLATHRRLYYDSTADRWIKKRRPMQASPDHEDFSIFELPEASTLTDDRTMDTVSSTANSDASEQLPPIVDFFKDTEIEFTDDPTTAKHSNLFEESKFICRSYRLCN